MSIHSILIVFFLSSLPISCHTASKIEEFDRSIVKDDRAGNARDEGSKGYVSEVVVEEKVRDIKPLKSGQIVTCLGDSITSGRADEPGLKSYVDVLNMVAESNFPPPAPWFVPYGDGGETIEMIANYWLRAEKRNPSFVFIQDGGLALTPLEKYERELRTLVKKVKLKGSVVLLSTTAHFGTAPPFKWDKHNELIKKIAGEEGTILVPLDEVFSRIETELGGKGKILTKDGKHPTGLGNFVIAMSILRSLGMSPRHLKLDSIPISKEVKEKVLGMIDPADEPQRNGEKVER